MRRHLTLLIVLLLGIVTLAACAKDEKTTSAGVIEKYLKAKVSGDAEKLVSLSCAEWEANAELDAASFESVKAKIEDMSCKESGQDGSYTLVTCAGQIVVDYGGEVRNFNLGDTTYRALQEDGEWRMCGEQ